MIGKGIITDEDRLLTPAETGEIMRVNPRQIARWAAEGKIRYTVTIGGHRRYYLSDIIMWQRGETPPGWTVMVPEHKVPESPAMKRRKQIQQKKKAADGITDGD